MSENKIPLTWRLVCFDMHVQKWRYRIKGTNKFSFFFKSPNDAREIWKRNFIFLIRPIVHTNPSQKCSFISTVRPTVHTNPSRKRSFENEAFRKRWRHDNHVISLPRVFLMHKSKIIIIITGYCYILLFLRGSVNGKLLICFQPSETSEWGRGLKCMTLAQCPASRVWCCFSFTEWMTSWLLQLPLVIRSFTS